jgi:hypothetical protein
MRSTHRIAGLVAGSLLAAVASAHHSFAAFDLARTTQIEGVLTEVRLVNPHSFLEVDVRGADGKSVIWAIEGLSPRQLFDKGLKRSALKAGDKVKLVVNPLRTGEPGGSLVSVTLADGTVLLGGPGQ